MQKILLAYDGGEPAQRALATTIELAHSFRASVAVVSVVPFRWATDARRDPWDDVGVHAQELVDAQHRLREHGIEPRLLEPAGDPARTIERIAAEGGFDTIVVGSRGLGAVDRAIQGSVSEHVATHAPATVVVVR